MPIAAALPAILSAGAGIAGSVIGGQNTSKAIRDATAAQNLANDRAIGAVNGNNQQNAGLYAPYLNSGSNALSQLDVLLGLGAPSMSPAHAALSSTPSYSAYVQNNPDVLAAYNDYGVKQGTSMDDFGKWHWNTFGQNETGPGGRTFTPFGQSQAPQDAPAAPQGSPQAQQQAAIDQLKASPLYQSLFRNGEQTVLASAAATGGLRGGNAEHSLYNVGNDTLAQVIQQQVANLGGLAGAGQSAAGSLAGFNTQGTGAMVGLLNQGGANTAGGILGANNANNSMTSGLLNGLGSLAGNSQLMASLGLGGGVKAGDSSGSQFGAPISIGTNGMTMPGTAFNPAHYPPQVLF